MGCFLACFGTSKSDHKRRKYRNQVQPRDHQRNVSFKALQSPGPSAQSQKPISSDREARETPPREQPSASPKKKVTFDSNVRTYEHVSTHEDSELFPESEDVERKKEKEKEKDKDLEKLSFAKASADESSSTSSLGSYPPNHRYQNCRDSDDKEELDIGDSDLDEEDEEDEDEDSGEIDYEDEIIEPKRVSEEVNSPMLATGFPLTEAQSMGLNRSTRDRCGYVHSVLNPVENLTQWKAVKAKATTKMKPQKENFSLDQQSRISFSSEPNLSELSLSFKSKASETIKPKQEMAVDASLSNWLVSPETTPVKTSTFAFNARSTDRAKSQGSNSVRSQDDRPILGALTVDEIRQFSASSSPRKSPSRSPDEIPIIGKVGTYWSHKDSGSATSFKGIPNTTSKYREDKIVNWHSTPFETRLERALKRGATEA